MQNLVALYEEILKALDARRLVREACARLPREPLVLALGKAAGEMYLGACDALGDCPGVLALKPDAPAPGGLARVVRGDHPIPDRGSLEAGEALLAAAAGADRPVLVLISGGGSALAEAPVEGLTLERLRAINTALVRSGAPIEEMNVVRKHLSRLKGGGLARALHAAGVREAHALVAVDVPLGGFPAVASGPAAADPSTREQAVEIARRLKLEGLEFTETLKPGAPEDFVAHAAVCDMRSASVLAERHGARILEAPVHGPLEALAEKLSRARGFVVASGEPDIRIPATALPGGRSQHLALLLARALRGEANAAFLAAGTDGRDGATEAAGALVTGETWDAAVARGLEPARALAEFDSSRVLAALGALLPARHTGAHAGDVFLLSRT